jgi:hypothetical protein
MNTVWQSRIDQLTRRKNVSTEEQVYFDRDSSHLRDHRRRLCRSDADTSADTSADRSTHGGTDGHNCADRSTHGSANGYNRAYRSNPRRNHRPHRRYSPSQCGIIPLPWGRGTSPGRTAANRPTPLPFAEFVYPPAPFRYLAADNAVVADRLYRAGNHHALHHIGVASAAPSVRL